MAENSSILPNVEFESPEEFISEEYEHTTGLAPDQLIQAREIVRKGNQSFQDNKVDEAIGYYSKALVFIPEDPVILSNRSAAFSRISKLLRSRSSSESEYQPLNGLDPTTHAALALKDAEKVLKVRSNSAKSYILKANALVLLDLYDEGRETLLQGLQVDPHSSSLQNFFKDLERISGCSVQNGKRRKLQHYDDFECILCLKLLYEPVTTPCGHSFCRNCLFQSMDHGNKCPICRTILYISRRKYPISVTLNNIIQKNFPEEHAERQAEKNKLTNLVGDIMPLFVMDAILPTQKLSINVFEPRYRLMIRRIMEGNRRMGMVIIDPGTNTISDIACEVEITECEHLPDGRFYLEVEGRRRFNIIRSWDQDGYRVAEVEWFQDTHPLENTPERDELQVLASRAVTAAQMLRQSHGNSRLNSRRSERMPSEDEPELLSFWLADLLNTGPLDRLNLLRMTDTRERITHMLNYQGELQGCAIQ
ncbi:LON peptidase N-terminal domain and ring finger 1 [Zostera marina]|uniref:LON peptidase N-terminal domain and ring finger 1 n=1 Tax=Zostera marina TaxID=29655 RepID=A0A0K9P0V6_ZOSMR|nr:LON peptidase N-terminal domain and ring finger 1 [Zostera marina]